MKKLITICLICVCLVAIGTSQAALIPLGTTAANFAVLGGSSVTNSGSNTILNGYLGVSPGSTVTGFPPGTYTGGIIHLNDAVAQLARSEVTATYNSLTTLTGTQDLTGHVLGSAGYETLTAGVYDFTAAAQLTGTLTLSGPGDFVFRISSSLGTSSNAKVLVTNGADAGNVYWQVGSSVTLNTGTAFKGNILTNSSITLNGGTLDGRALAVSSAMISTADAETITIPDTIPEPATICLLGLGALSLIRRRK